MTAIEGVLVVDKPPAMTSHDVVNGVRRVAGLRRVGHAGTLDPLATGVLLVCVGRATRLVEYLVGQPKTYVTAVQLGQTTNTYDADGEVVAERPFSHITRDTIAQALTAFRGPIQQKPPIYSAIKKDGQPLYKLARRGETIDVPVRAVTIYELSLLSVTLPIIELEMTCSSGTYVRSLAHDLGEALGCGGHVTALRRTAVGDFKVQNAVPLATLTPDNVSDYLLPTETAVAHLPALHLNSDEIEDIQHGRPIARQATHPAAELVQIVAADGRFWGVAVAQGYTWRPHKIFQPMGE
jgi:tRNA pseudouridine55 synthase